MVYRSHLFFLLVITVFFFNLNVYAITGRMKQPEYQSTTLTHTPGSARLYKPFSSIITTSLYGRSVKLHFIPTYLPLDLTKSESSDAEVTEDTFGVTLRGFMVIYDFGGYQKFILNMHQNNDQSPNDDFTESDEFYAMTDPFFDFVNKKRPAESDIISIDRDDVSTFSPFSDYILALLEKLLDYEVRHPHEPTDPRTWAPPLKNRTGQTAIIHANGTRYINLAYFFPPEGEGGCGHDYCLRPQTTTVEFSGIKGKEKIEIELAHSKSMYTDGCKVKLSRTASNQEKSYSISITKAASFTHTGNDFIDFLLKSAKDFIVPAGQPEDTPTAFTELKGHVHSLSNNSVVCLEQPSGSAPVVVVLPGRNPSDSEGTTIKILPPGSFSTRK
ncbi:hypothetical protein M3P05_01590 [Sansalvadorimonas sp. 2012CJ34-2]|uniref:Uncharacterized protein n=1 Tax=Parendozoicomonas callyspongiae TaxID=2942213 RepID=A0ABT0PC75_9GAMM|nr:hypothetical protein [Sansalvadorimonas sp. 2012CJ34-2]MCL6268646.1 hypothetical protein [Sansalvadorimonas sp. 2012CJ34-2]